MPAVKKYEFSNTDFPSPELVRDLQQVRSLLLQEKELRLSVREEVLATAVKNYRKTGDIDLFYISDDSKNAIIQALTKNVRDFISASGVDLLMHFFNAPLRGLVSWTADECIAAYQKNIDYFLENFFPPEVEDPDKFLTLLEEIKRNSEQEPVYIKGLWPRFGDCWLFKNALYYVSGSYSKDQVKLLILDAYEKEQKRFARLQRKFSTEQNQEDRYERHPIPEHVRIEVWKRDGGKCARCGSRENLEYDHIIPVSLGGSNTARNIELLCEKCNRSKGANIQ